MKGLNFKIEKVRRSNGVKYELQGLGNCNYILDITDLENLRKAINNSIGGIEAERRRHWTRKCEHMYIESCRHRIKKEYCYRVCKNQCPKVNSDKDCWECQEIIC